MAEFYLKCGIPGCAQCSKVSDQIGPELITALHYFLATLAVIWCLG